MATRISSTDSLDKWDAARQLLEDASSLMESSDAEGAWSLQSPGHFFSVCESLLADPTIDYSTQVYTYNAELLADDVDKNRIWCWLQRRAAVAAVANDKREREALCIACFDPIPDDPVDFEDVERLFSFLDDPHTTWAVFCAYENEDFPRNICEHFEWIMTKSAALRVTREEFEQMLIEYLKENPER